MRYIKKLPEIDELITDYPLSASQVENRKNRIIEVQNILCGKDLRKLLLVGPCSADREDAVVDYMSRLAALQEKIKANFVVVPRVYTSKPRTNGMGYKGLLHQPSSSSDGDDLLAGVIATRRMHLRVIQETGLFCVDEMLYPESIEYTLDLLAYVAIGARSVEDQGHRLTASGLQLPVGLKNPMSGDLNVLINSISATQKKHSMIYRGWEVQTEGNSFAHGIIRGYNDLSGKSRPNYHYETLLEIYDLYRNSNLINMSLIIDCSHGNSNKRYDEQMRIAREIFLTCKNYPELNRFIKGIMIESYIEDGSQLVGGGIYGKSITDPCLGWDKTKKLILELS
ncbi:MAG: 3-deoxy-7-phosphoheptulonate synthase [Defluviitaleaceae bacterium]|nr:3-deoxy-7-phosphoheptulonate synthase [Defluviitaleaceae bacterium]